MGLFEETKGTGRGKEHDGHYTITISHLCKKKAQQNTRTAVDQYGVAGRVRKSNRGSQTG